MQYTFNGLKPNTLYGVAIFPISKNKHFQTRNDRGRETVTTLPVPTPEVPPEEGGETT